MEPLSYNQEENQSFQGPSDIQMINLGGMFPDELVKLAEENYEMMNYEKCKVLYEEAMQRYSDNEKVLTSYGFFLSNMKEADKARDILSKAIFMNPHSNPKKYLYIAQLFEGNDAATFYTKAVEILTTQLEAAQNQMAEGNSEELDFQDIKKDLSQAYTALGELFMTDLARTENAINICREYLHKGAEVNPTNIDAYYQLMNYYLEVDDPETAEKSASQLMEIYRQAKESDNDDFFDEFPEETYLGTVKVLIEMQRFNDALVILEDLFQDNSNNMEVLYLMMYCNYMLKNYVTCKELLEEFNSKQENYEDKEIISAKDELEAMLRQVNVADANDWEDVDNEEECISNSDEENMEVEQ